MLAQAVVQILPDAPLLAVTDAGDLLFHQLTRSQVGKHHHAPLHLAMFVYQRPARRQQPDAVPAGGVAQKYLRPVDLLPQDGAQERMFAAAIRRRVRPMRLELFQPLGRRDFPQAGSHQPCRRGIEQDDISPGIRHHHPVAHAVEDGLQNAALLAQGAFRLDQLSGALFGGRAPFRHALLQSLVEQFQVRLRPSPFRHFVLQRAVGLPQLQRPLLHPRFQPFVRAAQRLLHPLAFRHLRHEDGRDGENHEPHGRAPKQSPGPVHGGGNHNLRRIPSRRRGQGNDQSRPASGEPRHKADGDKIENQQRDRADDVIHRPDVRDHDQAQDDERGVRFST